MQSEDFLPQGYSFELLSNFTVFKSYLQFGETNIEKELELISDAYNNRKSGSYKLLKEDPERFNKEVDKWIDSHYEEWHMVALEIGSRFRQSILIQLYSFMEAFLLKQCETHRLKYKKEYSVNDLKGFNDLDKIAKYMKNSAGKDLTTYPHWKFANNLRKLRNIIVHKESRINDKDTYNGIKEFAKGNFELKKGIGEYEYQVVLSSKEFISKNIDQMESFLQLLVIA